MVSPSAQGPWAGAWASPPAPVRRQSVPADYVRSVALAGGAPLLLPNTADARDVEAAVAAADALLLSGGGDVAASLYGRPNHPALTGVDELRDATEILAIRAAMDRGRPLLAICRGIQMLNVALGGTLIQDIPTQHLPGEGGEATLHGGRDHPIRLQRGSLLHCLWQREGGTVNSSHHQAVDRLAEGLRPTAWAPDGIIEAAESADGRNVLAVQFHPEKRALEDPLMLAPFRWLTDGASRR
jgi:putative glutamine amidotransferase